MANVKKRNWGFFVYPSKQYLESIGTAYDGADGYGTAPENWRDILQQTGLPVAISPLHDRDVNEDGSGRIKKPHWHVIVCYSGPTSFNVVKAITTKLNSPIPQALESIKGSYRYFTHKDNPEKAQYFENDITHINGFDILDYVDMTSREVEAIKIRILDLIRELDILEYCDLLDYLRDNELFAEFRIASTQTLTFNHYIKSRKYKSRGVGDSENI